MPDVPGVTHRTVDVDGLAVHVAEAGPGEPLVLLHGWPQHWYCWHRVVPLLADRYRLVMPDLRGHGWRMAYQVPLSTPALSQALLRSSPAFVQTVVRLGSRRPVPDTRTYGEVLQEPARARATEQLYRTFLLRESREVGLGRYADARLTVPTRLVNGDGDLMSSPALLEGWQRNADDMMVEMLDGVGHFVPEEVPEVVADRAKALFG
jgi:pimeloyl-ACP methyl ester carboxylesterase